MSALVIGNPLLPGSVTEQWGWGDIPHAEQEAVMVADMLQAQALVAAQVFQSREPVEYLYCNAVLYLICASFKVL
jgi:hypothetical protein